MQKEKKATQNYQNEYACNRKAAGQLKEEHCDPSNGKKKLPICLQSFVIREAGQGHSRRKGNLQRTLGSRGEKEFVLTRKRSDGYPYEETHCHVRAPSVRVGSCLNAGARKERRDIISKRGEGGEEHVLFHKKETFAF